MRRYYGKFVGRVEAVWSEGGRTMTLTQPLEYVDPTGVEWLAPSGSTVDGASIPRFIWPLTGGPFEGDNRKASVIHEVACNVKERPWEQVHETFYCALRAGGVGNVQAQILYAAVHHFGPRWPSQELPAPKTWMTERDFDDLKTRIETRAESGIPLTVAEIRDFQPPVHRVPGH